jgi:hypothetical protein
MEPRRPRGRPTVGERVPLGLRVTPELKRRLDAAAEQSGRSQSQEAEFRLERTFDRENLLPQVLSLAYRSQLAGVLMLLGAGMEEEAQRYLTKRYHITDQEQRWEVFRVEDRPGRSKKHHYVKGQKQRWKVHYTEEAEAFEFALIGAEMLLTALHRDPDAMDHVKQMNQPFQGLLDLVRAVRRGSKGRSLQFSTPSRDVSTIRSLLGPITDRLNEAKVAMAGQRLDRVDGETRGGSELGGELRRKIASMADALTKLINSSPRSPSRQELEELLQKQLAPDATDVGHKEDSHR